MTKEKKQPAEKPDPAAKKPAAEKKAEGKKPTEVDINKALQAELKSMNERVLRALAEAENTRRRAQREIEDTRAYSITSFAREMLTVQDNMRRALAHLPKEMKESEDYKSFVEGVEVTERELLNIFDRHGIKAIVPKGEAFDHNFHQAIFEVETADEKPGTIVQVIQEGYVIKDRLLRPAMVGVAKAPKADEAAVREEKPNEETPDE